MNADRLERLLNYYKAEMRHTEKIKQYILEKGL